MQTETIVFFLGNKIKFSSTVLIFGSRSMVALGMTVMSQSKRLDQRVSKQFCKFHEMINNGADLFRWPEIRLNI